MTDARIVTLALVFIAALGAILYNNSGITDLRTDTSARITELRADMNRRFDDVDRRFDDMNRHIDDKFALVIERLERMEDTFTRLLGDHETRLHKLEHPEA